MMYLMFMAFFMTVFLIGHALLRLDIVSTVCAIAIGVMFFYLLHASGVLA